MNKFLNGMLIVLIAFVAMCSIGVLVTGFVYALATGDFRGFLVLPIAMIGGGIVNYWLESQ